MKGKIGWIIGTLETIVGFVFFLNARIEISSNSWYTWRQPYSSYEAQVLMVEYIGIILLVCGIVDLAFKVYHTRYTNKHIQEIDQVVKNGGIIKCSNCGLTLAANVENCPRCGQKITD